MTLAEEMVRYRAKHGLSQGEFAKLCKINVMTVNYVERGLQTPTPYTEARIRLVLDEEKQGGKVKC